MTVSFCHAISLSSTLCINQLPLGVVSRIPRSKMSKDAIATPAPELGVEVGKRSVAAVHSPQPMHQDRVASKREDILKAKPVIGRKYNDNEVQRDKELVVFPAYQQKREADHPGQASRRLCDLVRAAPPCSFPTLPTLHDADI